MWGYGPNYGMMGYGYGGYGSIHMIIWVVIFVVIVAGLVWLVRSMSGGGASGIAARRSAGVEVLEERYARGEINRDEYLQKKRDILA